MPLEERVPVYGVYCFDNHPAVALGMITAYAAHVADGALQATYAFMPTVIKSMREARVALERHGPGVVMCSNYLWVDIANLEVARFAKQRWPDSVIVAGGPNVPKYEDACRGFFHQHPYIDVAVLGEGEVTAAEVLQRLSVQVRRGGAVDLDCLETVPGLVFRRRSSTGASDVVRTGDRPRVTDVNSLPSPYLSGTFDGERVDQWVSVIVETNRGCPYGCTFCDWGSATLSKVRQFSMQRVIAEIEWAAARRVDALWIADANFGIFKRDVEIAQAIASSRQRSGYPKRIHVNYAKQASERLAEIMSILRAADVSANAIISIQTQDPVTLSNIKRSNIKTSQYEELIKVFRKEDLPLSSDLMVGLPGATVESCKADFQFFFDREVHVRAYETRVLSNSPMAHPDYIKQFQIEVDRDGKICSTYSFTRGDLFVMKQLNLYFRIFVSYSILKYFLHYLQADHSIKALTVLHDLVTAVHSGSANVSLTRQLVEAISRANDFRPALRARTSDDWTAWYREISAFVTAVYGIRDPAMDTMLYVQQRLLPGTDRLFPDVLSLPHDVATYFADVRRSGVHGSGPQSHRPLAAYEAGALEIKDPLNMCRAPLTFDVDQLRVEWELDSPLLLGRVPPPHGVAPEYLSSAN